MAGTDAGDAATRRVAAMSVAKRACTPPACDVLRAEERGEILGQSVGYAIRFQVKCPFVLRGWNGMPGTELILRTGVSGGVE
eukprot:900669-Rhodomonas_salina.4